MNCDHQWRNEHCVWCGAPHPDTQAGRLTSEVKVLKAEVSRLRLENSRRRYSMRHCTGCCVGVMDDAVRDSVIPTRDIDNEA